MNVLVQLPQNGESSYNGENVSFQSVCCFLPLPDEQGEVAMIVKTKLIRQLELDTQVTPGVLSATKSY